MPEEIAIIIVVAILSGTLLGIVHAWFGYLRSKQNASGAGSSLGSGELKRLITEAVETALHPVLDRIEVLEEKDQQRRLNAPGQDEILIEEDTARRRVRQQA